MKKSLHEYVLAELEAAKGTWPEVSRDTGISLRTIQKISSGEIVDPGITKMERLANYFRSLSGKPSTSELRA